MVLTIVKLNLQVKELEIEHDEGQINLGNNVINFIMQYQASLNQVKAKIDLMHNQIAELAEDEQAKIAELKKTEVKK